VEVVRRDDAGEDARDRDGGDERALHGRDYSTAGRDPCGSG
jgi:hypothetical protein